MQADFKRAGWVAVVARRIFPSVFALLALTTGVYAATVQSDGAVIQYSQAGAPSAMTLVLIPGWSCASGVWKKQIAYFSKTMHIVVIDPRSQGDSAKTDDGNTPEQRAKDYETVFAALKLDHAVLVGWSQGVQDVAAYVDRFGTRRLSGIVLVDAAVSKGAAGLPQNAGFVKNQLGNIDLYARYKREYLKGMMHAIFAQPMPNADVQALIDTGMKTPTNTGIAELVADMMGKDRTPALAKFDKPTLIIASASSFELNDQKAEVSRLPHGSFTTIEHAAHGVFVDQPDKFNRVLSAFIAKL